MAFVTVLLESMISLYPKLSCIYLTTKSVMFSLFSILIAHMTAECSKREGDYQSGTPRLTSLVEEHELKYASVSCFGL